MLDVEAMLKKTKMIVFDADGVLIKPGVKNLVTSEKRVCLDSEDAYLEHCVYNDAYADTESSQRFKDMIDHARGMGIKCLVLTHEVNSFAMNSKTAFLQREYGFSAEDIMWVSTPEKKVDILKLLAGKYALAYKKIMFIEDTLPTANAASQSGFNAWHVSNFYN